METEHSGTHHKTFVILRDTSASLNNQGVKGGTVKNSGTTKPYLHLISSNKTTLVAEE
jgi:hypothetical protein